MWIFLKKINFKKKLTCQFFSDKVDMWLTSKINTRLEKNWTKIFAQILLHKNRQN